MGEEKELNNKQTATIKVYFLLFIVTLCNIFLGNFTCQLGCKRCTFVIWWKWSWFNAFVLLFLLFSLLSQLLGLISSSQLFPVSSSCFCCCSIKNSYLFLLSWGTCLCSCLFNLEKQNPPDIKERKKRSLWAVVTKLLRMICLFTKCI